MNNNLLIFSIIIPAHNESLYIKEVLEKALVLEYPKDKYEIIVVENGSTDNTYELAKGFEAKSVQVFTSSDKGVSKARNYGLKKVRSDCDWVIFLDADTVLEKLFLNDLNSLLIKDSSKGYVVGTAKIKPLPSTFISRFWFSIYDFGHRFLKTSYSIQFAKYQVLIKNCISYDEQMSVGEDLKFIDDNLKFGRFFFLQTENVYTSTRRFEKVGWLKLFFKWTILAPLPAWFKKKSTYDVIR